MRRPSERKAYRRSATATIEEADSLARRGAARAAIAASAASVAGGVVAPVFYVRFTSIDTMLLRPRRSDFGLIRALGPAREGGSSLGAMMDAW